MSWIEYHDALWHHHKIRRLAMLLDTPYTNALGMVSCLWLWTTMNAKDGNLSAFKDDDIADGAKHNGDPARFVSALLEVGILDADRKVHRWSKYGTRMLDDARERVELLRLRKRNVTETLPTERKIDSKIESKKESKPVKAALLHFSTRFKGVVGEAYPISWQKDYTLMAQVVKQYGEAKTLDLIDLFFEKAGEDGSWHRDKLCVGVFRHQLYKLVMALAEERAQ